MNDDDMSPLKKTTSRGFGAASMLPRPFIHEFFHGAHAIIQEFIGSCPECFEICKLFDG